MVSLERSLAQGALSTAPKEVTPAKRGKAVSFAYQKLVISSWNTDQTDTMTDWTLGSFMITCLPFLANPVLIVLVVLNQVSFVFCHANIALDFSENNKQWDPKKSSSGPHMQNC